MTSQEKYQELINDFKNALENFGNSLTIITLPFDEVVVDTIKSGQIQKFEMSTEIAWKCGKLFLEINFGEISISPKSVYKQLFLQEVINENLYLKLIDTIEDRNKLSHIYKEKTFNQILENIKEHCNTLKQYHYLINVT